MIEWSTVGKTLTGLGYFEATTSVSYLYYEWGHMDQAACTETEFVKMLIGAL